MIYYWLVYSPKKMLRKGDEDVKKCSKIVRAAYSGTLPLDRVPLRMQQGL
jgi:hypothetical protein